MFAAKLRNYMPKTSKALGVKVLLDYLTYARDLYSNVHVSRDLDATWLIGNSPEVVALELRLPQIFLGDMPNDGWFARPCPTNPRHGFVESRRVSNYIEIQTVVDETFAADPEGEVLLQPYVPAALSAVFCNQKLTIGQGTDGVTDGKGTTTLVHIPPDIVSGGCLAPIPQRAYEALTKHKKFDPETQDLMYELLLPQGTARWVVVQIRVVDKAVGNTGSNYWIPTDNWKVNLIVPVKGTPLTIESMLKEGAFPINEGTIYRVHNMQSHIACQLIEAGRPICNHYIKSGNVLTLAAMNKPEWTTENYKDLGMYLRGVFGDSPLDQFKSRTPGVPIGTGTALRSYATGLASAMAKQTQFLDPTPMNLNLLCMGIYSMIWYSAVAVIGESRHFFSNWEGTKYAGLGHRAYSSDYYYNKGKGDNGLSAMALDRSDIYAEYAHDKTYVQLMPHFQRAVEYHGRNGWRPGYGGFKWKSIGDATIDLYNQCKKYIANPSELELRKLFITYNRASYQCHNGGSGPLTKFTVCTETWNVFTHMSLQFTKEYLPKRISPLPALRKLVPIKKLTRTRRLLVPNGIHPGAHLVVTVIPTNLYAINQRFKWCALFPNKDHRKLNCPAGMILSGRLSRRFFETHLTKDEILALEHSNFGITIPVTHAVVTEKQIQWGKSALTGDQTLSKVFTPLLKLLCTYPMVLVSNSQFKESLDSNLLDNDDSIKACFRNWVPITHSGEAQHLSYTLRTTVLAQGSFALAVPSADAETEVAL